MKKVIVLACSLVFALTACSEPTHGEEYYKQNEQAFEEKRAECKQMGQKAAKEDKECRAIKKVQSEKFTKNYTSVGKPANTLSTLP